MLWVSCEYTNLRSLLSCLQNRLPLLSLLLNTYVSYQVKTRPHLELTTSCSSLCIQAFRVVYKPFWLLARDCQNVKHQPHREVAKFTSLKKKKKKNSLVPSTFSVMAVLSRGNTCHSEIELPGGKWGPTPLLCVAMGKLLRFSPSHPFMDER